MNTRRLSPSLNRFTNQNKFSQKGSNVTLQSNSDIIKSM